jgi:tetratricopeptide (TPR) repeat protein
VEALPEAKIASLKAIELDPSLAEAHVSLGHIRLWLDWDWQAAEREFKQGIALNPASPLAHTEYATYLAAMGRATDSIAEARSAQALDSLSPIVNTDLGWCLLYGGRRAEAVTQFRSTVELDPNYASAHWGLGVALASQRLYQEAIVELKRALSLSEGSPVLMGHLGFTHGLSGGAAEASAVRDDLKMLSAREYVPSSALALVEIGLGNKAGALELLQRAHDEHDFSLVFLQVAPWFDSLRGDAKFEQLARRMQLPAKQ